MPRACTNESRVRMHRLSTVKLCLDISIRCDPELGPPPRTVPFRPARIAVIRTSVSPSTCKKQEFSSHSSSVRVCSCWCLCLPNFHMSLTPFRMALSSLLSNGLHRCLLREQPMPRRHRNVQERHGHNMVDVDPACNQLASPASASAQPRRIGGMAGGDCG